MLFHVSVNIRAPSYVTGVIICDINITTLARSEGSPLECCTYTSILCVLSGAHEALLVLCII